MHHGRSKGFYLCGVVFFEGAPLLVPLQGKLQFVLSPLHVGVFMLLFFFNLDLIAAAFTDLSAACCGAAATRP